jgi:hypothetical protein
MGGVMIHALASACVVLLFHHVHHMLAEEGITVGIQLFSTR